MFCIQLSYCPPWQKYVYFQIQSRSGTFSIKALLKVQLTVCIHPFKKIFSSSSLIFKKYFQKFFGKIMLVVPVSNESITATESFHLTLSFVFLLRLFSHAKQKLHWTSNIKNRAILHMENLFNLVMILSCRWCTVTWRFMETFEGLNTASRSWQCKHVYLEILISRSC